MADQLEEVFGNEGAEEREIKIDSEVLFKQNPSNVASCVIRVDPRVYCVVGVI